MLLLHQSGGVDAITTVKLDNAAAVKQSVAAAIEGSVPYCVYLEQSQELDCVCPDGVVMSSSSEVAETDRINHMDSAPINFPNEDYLMAATSKNGSSSPVASVKLHSCSSLNLRLDLRSMARPFYR